MPACIIPLGPDFKDPPAAQNTPPEILSATPALLSQVLGSTVPGMATTFSVTVTDQNTGDDLYIRWFSDYPPMTSTTRALHGETFVAHPTDGVPKSTPIDTSLSCVSDLIAGGFSLHTIVVMVADRKFADTSSDLTLLEDGSHAVIGGWLLNLTCPPQ